MKKEKFLTPITCEMPQQCHTRIRPQCFTCEHFRVCNLREDMLKTCHLVESILGHPSQKYLMRDKPMEMFPQFTGIVIDEELFKDVETIKTTKELTGTFGIAKYENENLIRFIYCFDEVYFVLFEANFNQEEWVISKGIEAYYKAPYEITKEDKDKIAAILKKWRTTFLENKVPDKKCCCEKEDIINTTFFSSEIRCHFYEWNKKPYDESIQELIKCYPKGIPMGKEIYHIATFHCEPHQVPYYHPENGIPVYVPIGYPVVSAPPPKKKKHYIRRDCLEHE